MIHKISYLVNINIKYKKGSAEFVCAAPRYNRFMRRILRFGFGLGSFFLDRSAAAVY